MGRKKRQETDSEPRDPERWIKDAEKDPNTPLPSGAFIATMAQLQKFMETANIKFDKIDKHLKNLYGQKEGTPKTGNTKPKLGGNDILSLAKELFKGGETTEKSESSSLLEKEFAKMTKENFKAFLGNRAKKEETLLMRERIKNIALLEDLGIDPDKAKKWGITVE